MIIPLNFGGGGGSGSDDVTATKAQVLEGFTAITHDSNDEPIEGIMIDNGAVSQVLTASTPSIIISQGYHNGQGQVSIAPQEKTVSATTSSQAITPDSGKVLSKVTVRALSQSNLASSNIVKGKTITINNGSSNVWSVSGNNNTLKMVSGSVYVGKNGYSNVNAGITPLYEICVGTRQVLMRTGAKSGYCRGSSGQATTTSNGNFGGWSSSSVGVPNITTTDETITYYIFGY